MIGVYNIHGMGDAENPNWEAIFENIRQINKNAAASSDLEYKIGDDSLKSKAISLIAELSNIDVVAGGNINLFTIPLYKKLIITNTYIIPEEITSFTSSFSASVGSNSTAFDNIFGIKDFTGLDSVNKVGQYIALSDILIVNNASDIIKLKITTNAIATTYKVKVLLFGFYL